MRRQGVNSDGEVMSSFYVDKGSDDYSLHFNPDEGKTRQEFAEECDINILMSRYEKTGQLPGGPPREPQYLDVSEVPDLQTALQFAEAANSAFMTLPAKVRFEFDNDPMKFVAYAENPENLEQMREWGLARPEEVPEPPTRVEVVNPPPSAAGGQEPSNGS